jgi:hypothetical protein
MASLMAELEGDSEPMPETWKPSRKREPLSCKILV